MRGYVSIWRVGIESRMPRPFRVPGVVSRRHGNRPHQAKSPKIFRRSPLSIDSPSSSCLLLRLLVTRLPVDFPVACFCRHCFAFYRLEIKCFAMEEPLQRSQTRAKTEHDNADGKTRVASIVDFTMYHVFCNLIVRESWTLGALVFIFI
mgnify:CR=1 FL=1